MNAKQNIAFPEVAILRKGSPKRKNPKRPDQMMQGQDLGNRFRIAFLPGTDHHRADFERIYIPTLGVAKKEYGPNYAEPYGYEVERIRCMVTTRSALDAWEWYNEAYNAGRLIARADDEKFLMMRDPANGAFIVQDGEPFTPYQIGKTIDYVNNRGATISLPIKTHGRLRLLLPDLGRLVYVTLKTTSFYDRLNITANLAAIQFLAETLNNGNAAGIPFWVYRREQEVVWNKPDGSAQRIKKWVVNIEADPEWVTSAMARLSRFALGDGAPSLALPAPVEISTPIDPNQDGEDEAPPEADEAEDVIEGESEEAAEPAEDLTDLPNARPYAPEVVRQKIAGLVARYANYTASDKQRQLLAMSLNEIFVGNEAKRKALTYYLVEVDSVSKMSGAQVNALLGWLKLTKADTGEYFAEKLSRLEANACYTQAMKEQGQGELPL